MSDEQLQSVTFRLDKETKEKMERLAEQEERTLSAQLCYLFRHHVFPHLDRMLGDQPSTGRS
jgi:hypothetical protein